MSAPKRPKIPPEEQSVGQSYKVEITLLGQVCHARHFATQAEAEAYVQSFEEPVALDSTMNG